MVASPGHATTAQKRCKQIINNAMDQAQEWDEIAILYTPVLCVSTNLSGSFSPLTHALPAQSWGLKTNRN